MGPQKFWAALGTMILGKSKTVQRLCAHTCLGFDEFTSSIVVFSLSPPLTPFFLSLAGPLHGGETPHFLHHFDGFS